MLPFRRHLIHIIDIRSKINVDWIGTFKTNCHSNCTWILEFFISSLKIASKFSFIATVKWFFQSPISPFLWTNGSVFLKSSTFATNELSLTVWLASFSFLKLHLSDISVISSLLSSTFKYSASRLVSWTGFFWIHEHLFQKDLKVFDIAKHPNIFEVVIHWHSDIFRIS